MAQAFLQFDVSPAYKGGTVLTWRLHPQLRVKPPFTFYSQFGRGGTDGSQDWRTFDTATGSGRNSLYSSTDPDQRVWSLADRAYYQVILVDADGRRYGSGPQNVFGKLNRRETVLARNILMMEAIRLRQPGVGLCGLLFRRRDWGTPCDHPGCLDPDLGTPTHIACPICYSTGWRTGYYTPVDFAVSVETTGPVRLENSQYGFGVNGGGMDMKVRAAACPLPRTGDVWLQSNTDDHWYVDSVDATSMMGTQPLTLRIVLRLAEPTDVVYELGPDHVG